MITIVRKRKKERELPLTAMIDIVFILIFFFMLTTSFMRIESMEVKLPAAKGGSSTIGNVTRIVLYDDGSLTYGERNVDTDGLKQTLKLLLASNPQAQLMVYADEKVNLSRLVEVMDILSVMGAKSVYVRPLPKSITPQVDAS